jgi:hypothetical protein
MAFNGIQGGNSLDDVLGDRRILLPNVIHSTEEGAPQVDAHGRRGGNGFAPYRVRVGGSNGGFHRTLRLNGRHFVDTGGVGCVQ